MKVRDLIDELESFDPEMEVRFEQPTHDHWRSVIAREPRSFEEGQIKRSEYHRADVVVHEEDDDWKEEGDAMVLLIS